MRFLKAVKKAIQTLKCEMGYHKFNAWEPTTFIYEIEGRSKPLKAYALTCECKFCQFRDEKPESNIWN